MFNLIAHYIGYGTEAPITVQEECANLDCSFGEAEVDDWTLIDVKNSLKEDGDQDDFLRIPSPSPIVSLHSSTTEIARLEGSAVMISRIAAKRSKCLKNPKRQRTNATNNTFQRPNQMKRSNQVVCQRGNKAFQKMRQIVHQPRKF